MREMKNFLLFSTRPVLPVLGWLPIGRRTGRWWRPWPLAALVAASLLLSAAEAARAQATYAGDQGGSMITVGVTGTGEQVQYGGRKMIGLTGFADLDTHRRLGIELEGRWTEWHQTADVHLETYSAGLRYHFDFGRWSPYVKGLAGKGDFNFPYDLATGSYLVVTGGGGVDYHYRGRLYFRVADFEYQDWPQFTYGTMGTGTLSAGIRVRVF